MNFRRVMTVLPLILLVGCASVNSVSLTPIPADRSNPVRTSTERTVFLGFNFDNDYIDPIVADLKRQCPNGVVSGIMTKDETIAYFIVFTRRVTATGYCSKAVAKNTVRKRRSTASEDPGTIEGIVDDEMEN